MDAEVRCFWTPKAGNSTGDYEDAFCVSSTSESVRCHANVAPDVLSPPSCVPSLRLAVADGASESSFAGVWAKLLVQSFCRVQSVVATLQECDVGTVRVHDQTMLKGFERARAVWQRCYATRKLPWYAEQKRDMGAFAAFLGLEVLEPEHSDAAGSWVATAIGDACVFQFRQDALLRAFPIDTPEVFSQSPLLLTSKQSAVSQAEGIQCLSGEWQSGDEFLLLTDAAACWLLKSLLLRDADPLGFLHSIRSQQDFSSWVGSQRAEVVEGQPRLRNDDVTFVACRISNASDRRGQL
jgi:hypothetical protein